MCGERRRGCETERHQQERHAPNRVGVRGKNKNVPPVPGFPATSLSVAGWRPKVDDVTARLKEKELREKVAGAPDAADAYLELASLLFETGRSGESIDTLRRALRAPLGDIPRAKLLTSLGWYIYDVTDGAEEPRTLGERAIMLTEGTETGEGLVARAIAEYLLAECAWLDDVDRAEELAASIDTEPRAGIGFLTGRSGSLRRLFGGCSREPPVAEV